MRYPSQVLHPAPHRLNELGLALWVAEPTHLCDDLDALEPPRAALVAGKGELDGFVGDSPQVEAGPSVFVPARGLALNCHLGLAGGNDNGRVDVVPVTEDDGMVEASAVGSLG